MEDLKTIEEEVNGLVYSVSNLVCDVTENQVGIEKLKDVVDRKVTPFCLQRNTTKSGDVQYKMYAPIGSVVVGAKEAVPQGTGADDYVSLSYGTWWCLVSPIDKKDSREYVFSLEEEMSLRDRVLPENSLVFKICYVSKNRVVRYVSGSIILSGDLAFDDQYYQANPRVAFRISHFYIDTDAGRKIQYRIYTPSEGSVVYKGETLPVEEAIGEWTYIETPKEGESVEIYCWGKDGKAHVTRYSDMDSKHKDFRFSVCSLEGSGEGEDVSVGFRSLIFCPVKYANDRETQLIGAEVSGAKWSEILSGYGESLFLTGGEATKSAVLDALAEYCSRGGTTAFIVNTHGGDDGYGNSICSAYDANISDKEIWDTIKGAKGNVWMVCDTCHSETMYGPPGTEPGGGRSLSSSMGDRLRALSLASPGSVNLLFWGATKTDEVGWCREDFGMIFSNVCFDYIDESRTYAEAWELILADTTCPEQWDMHPNKTQLGLSFEPKKMFF